MSEPNYKTSAESSTANPAPGKLLWLLQITGLALAYFVTGKLGTFLAIPPGYATAIWPPSGIALASILIYGYRVWPGIFLGSFFVNLTTSIVASFFSHTLNAIIITLVISLGATLQAGAGAYLVRRFADFPSSLTREKDVFLFLLFGGVLSTLFNSTLSVSTLLITGQITAANFPVNWATWWMGDVLGIFIFLPLVFAWMQPPCELWKHRRLVITLPIIAMFGLTTSAVFYESQNDKERLTLEFDQQAHELNSALEKSMSSHINVLRSLGSFYSASSTVNRNSFRIFVTESLDDFHGIQALSWNPRILSPDRNAYELSVKNEGYPSFQITERNAAKQLLRAGDRPEYVSVRFIEPFDGNESALGFDVYSDELRHEAIDRARNTGDIAATARITLVQERKNQFGALAFMPVYRKDLPHKTLEERQNSILGYLVAVFRGEDIITATLNNLNRDRLSYQLIDESAASADQLIYTSEPDGPKISVQKEKGLFSRNFSLIHNFIIPVGGRQWRLQITPTQVFFDYHHSNNAWLILLAGLILTSMVSSFALMFSGRGSLLRQLVEDRTTELAQSEERFRVTFEGAPVGIVNVSLDGYFLNVNQGFCDIVGYSRNELLSMTFTELTDPDYHQSDTTLISQLLAGKTSSFNKEKKYVHKNGQLVWGNLSVKLIRDKEDVPFYFVAVVEDIDRRKQAELQLKESELRFRVVADAAPVLIWLAGTDKLCFWFNQTWMNFTGRTLEQELDNGWAKGIHPDDLERYLDIYIRHFDRREPFQVEYRLKHNDGNYRWIDDHGVPRFDADGFFTGYIGSCMDITDLRQAKLAAEALARAKSEFLANMSHEIRTPMNAIMGLSHLALNNEVPDETRDYLEKINSASNDLLNILNDILDLSKMESGHLSITNNNFDLNSLTSNLNNLFLATAEEKRIDLKIDIAPNVPCDLTGDPLRLKQVLINLLGNAIKFSSNGKVTLNITLLDRSESQASLLFSVTDTGIGMSDKDIEKLFLPFSQVDGSISRRFGGTGLGLAISDNLLKLMNSHFLVESIPGKGSSFSFELVLGLSPVTSKPKAESNLESPTVASDDSGNLLVGKRILVVEDIMINQLIIGKFLKLSGIIVSMANNGLQALEQLEAGEFDAVLMDIHMPEMDGFEATQLIRRQARFATLPVIALTAGVTEEEQDKCLALGMNDFIAKPINPEKLILTLQQWLKPVE